MPAVLITERIGWAVHESSLATHTADIVHPNRGCDGASSKRGSAVGPHPRSEHMHVMSVQTVTNSGSHKGATKLNEGYVNSAPVKGLNAIRFLTSKKVTDRFWDNTNVKHYVG